MSNNKILNPQAKESLDKLKFEVAEEVGVDLKEGYNGDITAHDAGKIGGGMVKKLIEIAEKNISENKEG